MIEQFYPNYEWKEDLLKIQIDIDDVHFLIECRYEYNGYLNRIRLKESYKEEELLTKEEEITKQLEKIDIDDLIEKSRIIDNYDRI